MLNKIEKVCQTEFPIVLIHGTGFRDRKVFGYWGRIPKALTENGAVIFYGHQDSWSTIETAAGVLKDSVEKALAETGAEKVNLIAHSKGGLESRYLISSLGMAAQVASLTTVVTPHHGSKTMDKVCRLPKWLFELASIFANLWFRVLGDENPDFHKVCKSFTTFYMEEFNKINLDANGVYYQSYAAVMKNPFSDFILWFPNLIISLIEGENDGLVTQASARWTNFKGVLRGSTNRGISHADEVDIRRVRFSNKLLPGTVNDICDVYVQIAADLKNMGF